nr:phosphotransferase [Mycobacterium sp. E136]
MVVAHQEGQVGAAAGDQLGAQVTGTGDALRTQMTVQGVEIEPFQSGGQWELVRREGDERDDDVKRLHTALGEALPAQSRSAIVHGDYRIDNTMLDAEYGTKVLAVLDWEMSTLGDPISDAALMCVYRHPMFNLVHADAAWASPLIPPADELAQRYSVASGQPLDHWEFYMGLAYFKLAIIAAGIAYRGRVGGAPSDFVTMVDDAVAPLIDAGLESIR